MSNSCSSQFKQINPLATEGHDNIDNNEQPEDDNKSHIETQPPQDTTTFEKNKYTKRKKYFIKMCYLLNEIALVVLVVSAYASLTNNPPKLTKSPAAYPFFPKDSIVKDWYRGQLSAAIEKARESEIAVVMFYAPWDAESQIVRHEFEIVAKHMHKQFAFAAVNCWHPGGECRRQYNKAYNWPVLIVYTVHGRGVQYRGPRTAAHIMKFLTSVSRPIMRVTDFEVNVLRSTYDAVIVGCVNALPGSYDYAVLYGTALRFLEKDPFQEMAFTVLTLPETDKYGDTAPSLQLHMWNETLYYPSDGEWKTDALLAWIFKNLHQVSIWVSPTGSKSMALASVLQPGPALLLFTPRNPLEHSVDYYDLLHEIGLEYYNCGNVVPIMITSFLTHSRRFENRLMHEKLLNKCAIKIDNDIKLESVVTYAIPKKWANNSCCTLDSKLPKDLCAKCNTMDLLKDRLPKQCKSPSKRQECFSNDRNLRVKFRTCQSDEDNEVKLVEDDLVDVSCPKVITSMITGKNDPRSPKNLQKLLEREKCRMARLALKVHAPVFSNIADDYQYKQINITGLGCASNISLTLVALDSLQHHYFAERLGVNLSKTKDKTVAVIINEKLETHHIMPKPVNDITLRQFIINFTENNLPRNLHSTSAKHWHTHVYPQQKKCDGDRFPHLCLLELTTDTFLPTVMQADKTVIVMYHSKQCSFCSGVSYKLLTVVKVFSNVTSIQFARIDGDLNALPWEFTMETYPTILFFPARRKAESRAFPRNVPITVPNLVSFILANLHPTLRLHAMWTLCNQTKFEDEKLSCITSIRAENLSLIDHTSRAWRKADLRTKAELIYKLKLLRNLNLLLANAEPDLKGIEKQISKLNANPEIFQDSKSAEENRNFKVKEEL